MFSADTLLAQLQAQRREWVPVDKTKPDGVAVHMDTASQYAAHALAGHFRSGDGDALAGAVVALARDWRNVPQSLVLGAGVGSDDPAPFHAEVLRLLLLDRPAWAAELAVHALDQAMRARERVEGASGN